RGEVSAKNESPLVLVVVLVLVLDPLPPPPRSAPPPASRGIAPDSRPEQIRTDPNRSKPIRTNNFSPNCGTSTPPRPFLMHSKTGADSCRSLPPPAPDKCR